MHVLIIVKAITFGVVLHNNSSQQHDNVRRNGIGERILEVNTSDGNWELQVGGSNQLIVVICYFWPTSRQFNDCTNE